MARKKDLNHSQKQKTKKDPVEESQEAKSHLPAVVEKSDVIIPPINKEQSLEMIRQRKEFLAALVDPTDVFKLDNKEFKLKKYWRKLANAFSLSLEKKEERTETNAAGWATYHFVFRASLPTGQFADGTGSCTQNEKNRSKSLHDTRATAETRAKNRAISDLVAWGEVSAEEVMAENNGEQEDHFQTSAPAPANKPAERATTATVVNDDSPEARAKARNDIMHKKINAWIKNESVVKGNYDESLATVQKAIASHDVKKWDELNDAQKFSVFSFIESLVGMQDGTPKEDLEKSFLEK